MKLIAKLQVLLFLITILIFSLFSYVAYNYDEMRFLDQTKQNLTAIANIQKNRLIQFLDNSKVQIKMITNRTELKNIFSQYLRTKEFSLLGLIDTMLYDMQKSLEKNISISLTDLEGKIITSTDKKLINTYKKGFPTSKELLQQTTFSTHLGINNTIHFESKAPLYKDGKILGTLIIDSTMNSLAQITDDYTGLGETGETVIAKSTPNGALFLTPLRFDSYASHKRTMSATKKNTPIIKALNGEIGFFTDTVDYREKEVYSSTEYIKDIYWGITVKIDKKEVDDKLKSYRTQLLSVLIYIFPFILFISYLISRSFAQPILNLTQVVKSFGEGNYENKADELSSDELGILAKTFNLMTEEMNKTQRRLEEAQGLVKMGSWELDVNTGALFLSQNIYTIFEIKSNQRKNIETYKSILKFIHKDDKKYVVNSYKNSIIKHEKYHVEHRIVTATGKIKFVEEMAIHQRDADEQVTKSYGAIIDITEQKEKNFKLQEQIRLTNEHIILSTTNLYGQINYASKAFCEISGYSHEELVGENHRIERHPDMPNEVYKDLWETLLKRETWRGEIKNKKKDGGYYWVYATISPVYNIHNNIVGYTAIREDITDKKSIQKAQRIAKMGSWELDFKHNTIQCSAELCNLFEINVQAYYKSETLIHFIKPVDRKRVLDLMAKSIKNDENFEVEFEIVTPFGKEKMMYALGEVSLDTAKKPLKLMGILLDITERKKIEKQLNDAKILAEQASVAKGNFVANMSHEIRTPMNAVLGFTDLALKTNNLGNDAYAYLKKSQSAAVGLLAIINDILDFSKIESKKFAIEKTTFNLKNLLSEITELIEFQAVKKNLALNVVYGDISDCFIGDALRIKQILINIVGNSVKFTQKGYVSIEVKKDNEYLQFKISDSGIGMSPSQLETIFEPFVQADSSIVRDFGGTGLGTVISKELIELMQGKIEVSSIFGKGSTFIIKLPLEEVDCPKVLLENKSHLNIHSFCKRLFRILLVEDNKLNAELIQINLADQLGHTIFWVKNGKEALIEITKNYSKYDLILMDVQMPVMDGIQTTREIRKIEKNTKKHISIIALTALVTMEEQENTKKAGMDGFALKPIVMQDLLFQLEKVVPSGIGRKNTVIHSRKVEEISEDLDYLLPTINAKIGLKIWTSKQKYLKALKSFVKNHHNDMKMIKNALQIKNYTDALRILHTLKGLSFGFDLLYEKSHRLHDQIVNKEKNLEIDSLQESFDVTIELINSLHIEEETISVETFKDTVLIQNIQTLLNMLENGESDDPLALKLFTSLKKVYNRDECEKFYESIENFDYEMAYQILQKIDKNLKKSI